MNRRLLLGTGLLAGLFMLLGLLVADYPLARWVHSSGIENAAIFKQGLNFLDHAAGMHIWFWLAACLFIGLGLLGIVFAARLPLPRRLAPALLAAGLVQAATIGMMILGKNIFGRLRPFQVLESGDWAHIWFAGGGSFPSGHSAFYFGLFLPLAASAPRVWQRALLLAIPVFVISARIDLSMHFLSDVSTSALIASVIALLVASLMRHRLAAM
jgi:membrane-associated phospholipid phosphatase